MLWMPRILSWEWGWRGTTSGPNSLTCESWAHRRAPCVRISQWSGKEPAVPHVCPLEGRICVEATSCFSKFVFYFWFDQRPTLVPAYTKTEQIRRGFAKKKKKDKWWKRRPAFVFATALVEAAGTVISKVGGCQLFPREVCSLRPQPPVSQGLHCSSLGLCAFYLRLLFAAFPRCGPKVVASSFQRAGKPVLDS